MNEHEMKLRLLRKRTQNFFDKILNSQSLGINLFNGEASPKKLTLHVKGC